MRDSHDPLDGFVVEVESMVATKGIVTVLKVYVQDMWPSQGILLVRMGPACIVREPTIRDKVVCSPDFWCNEGKTPLLTTCCLLTELEIRDLRGLFCSIFRCKLQNLPEF